MKQKYVRGGKGGTFSILWSATNKVEGNIMHIEKSGNSAGYIQLLEYMSMQRDIEKNTQQTKTTSPVCSASTALNSG